jgi:hypothetical protein
MKNMVPPPVVAGLEPIAIFTHDHDSPSPLRAWPPVPAETIHQGEMLAIHAFGSLLDDVRSPRHIYFAAWRDPNPSRRPDADGDDGPTAILFFAQFGVAPYETSRSLIESAETFNRSDRAGLRLDLVRGEDGDFRLDALEVDLNAPSSKRDRHFRSCWKGEELRTVDLSLQFDAPATRLDPFRFHLHARLPRRYNQGAAIERGHVEFTVSGGAMPLPHWVNY